MHTFRPRSLFVAAAAALALAPSAQAVEINGLAGWDCLGNCGSLLPVAGESVAASGVDGGRYGYVTTAGSTARQAPAQLAQDGKSYNSNPLTYGAVPAGYDVISPLWLGDKPTDKNTTPTEQNGSRYTSAAFTAGQGQVLNLAFNFVTSDGTKAFGDYAWARLASAVDNSTAAVLFTARSSNSGNKNVVPGGIQADFGKSVPLASYAVDGFHAMSPNWSALGDDSGTCYDNANTCGVSGWVSSRYSFTAGQVGQAFRIEVGVINFTDTAYASGLAFDMQGLSPAAPVPEPESVAMMLAGLAALGFIGRRRRQPRG